MKHRKQLGALLLLCLSAGAFAQVPDLLNSLDAGASSMGAGGALYGSGSGTISSYYNPAGLAYTQKKEMGVTLRNLPKSNTTSAGNSNDRRYNTVGTPGKKSLSHLGFNFPVANAGGTSKGVIGLSYTLGGYVNDNQTSTNLSFGSLTSNDYRLQTRARSDFYTLAFAKASADKSSSFGVGFVYLRQLVGYDETGSLRASGNTGQPDATLNTHNEDLGYGYGAIIGFQGSPKDGSVSWGLSYRTPISIKGNASTAGSYSKVPGRILGSLATRKDNLRGGKDYLVYGVQGQYFSGGQGSAPFVRNNQFVTDLGLEYNVFRFGGRVPLRLGYNSVPSGGSGYNTRNALTYGFGYRPEDERFGFDVGFASPQNGGFDIAIGLTYKLDK